MRSLLVITKDLEALDDLLFEIDGDVSNPAVQAAVDQWFAELEGDVTEKVGNYVGLIREKELRAAAVKEEADRLAKRARIEGEAASWLKATLKMFLEGRRIKKLATDRGNVSVCANGGKPPLVIDRPGEVPTAFMRQPPPVPDTEAIRAAIEGGAEIGFAHIAERGTHLRIS